MANFKASLSHLLRTEGGWVNDPDDLGKETYCGISRRFYPQWAGWLIIDKLRDHPLFPECLAGEDQLYTLVEQFYYQEYWGPAKLDKVNSDIVADEIFEMAVNLGAVTAVRYVQQALNLLNKAGALYKDTLVDGIMGSETLQFINRFTGKEKPLVRTINGIQFEHYVDLCRRNPKQEKFFYGWLTRT